MEERVVIIDSARLPIGKYGGIYRDVKPEILGAVLIKQMLSRSSIDPHDVAELITGNIVSGGGNIARKIGLQSGLPVEVPAFTVDRQCASGLEAFTLAYAKIKSGLAALIICGGVESTSRAPWQIERPTNLYATAPNILKRQALSTEEYGDPDMGIATEAVAEKLKISRVAQDDYARRSQQKYKQAYLKGHFKSEILPFDGHTADESPRLDTTLEKLSKLKPVFMNTGTLTAGNSSPLNDGASFSIVASSSYCDEHQITPDFEVVHSVSIGVNPNEFGVAPVQAIEKLLKEVSLSYQEIDRFEINEAFSAQILACIQLGSLPLEKINVSGGALAFGHPFGATGAILVRRLMTELTECGGTYGIVSLCVGGGQGTALLIKRIVK